MYIHVHPAAHRQHLRWWSTKCLAWSNGTWAGFSVCRRMAFGDQLFGAPAFRPLRPISLARSADGLA